MHVKRGSLLVKRVLFRGFITLLVLVWVAVPAAAIYWLSDRAVDVAIVDAQPAEVAVQPNTTAVSTPRGVVIQRVAAPVVFAPAWSGTVTEVLVSPGAVVTQGTPVMAIDGVTRLGYHSSAPFHRELAEGSVGADVLALNLMLSELGFTAGGSTTFSGYTKAGVRQLSVHLGHARTEVFDPSWIVWIPQTSLTVATINVTVSAPAPTSGTRIVTGRAPIQSAFLVESPDGVPGAAPSPDQAGTDPADEVVDPGEQSADGDAPEPAPSMPDLVDLAVTAPEGATIFIGATEIPLADDRSQVAPDGLAMLEALATKNETSLAVLQQQEPAAGQWSVPPAAVFSTAQGELCLIRVRDGSQHPIPVVVVGGDYTRSVITGDLTAGDRTVTSPRAAERSCA